MKTFRWQNLKDFPRLLSVQIPDVEQQRARLRYMERDIGLPVKGLVVGMLFYYLFLSHWFAPADASEEVSPPQLGLVLVRYAFFLYIVINVAVGCILMGMHQVPLLWAQRAVFTIAWIDAAFLSLLAAVTGGYDSILYWVFLALILRNSVSMPGAGRQLTLNTVVTLGYILSGTWGSRLDLWESQLADEGIRHAIEQETFRETGTEPVLLRLSLLVLMTACCYGLQVLLDRQRRAAEEALEFQTRQEQLAATGRLAAEIAHQLKNPLGIINNAAFTLQRTMKEGKTITQQIQIIREEVERSDRIITELMGYARLTEGRVEKLDVIEELDRAIQEVFPAGAKYDVKVVRDYAPALPFLLLQRAHLSEVFVNLLQNAREAMAGKGTIFASAHYGENYSIEVQIRDTGPGIPKGKLPHIFEPYYTTKVKGTGLGLSIVKHNTELYGGTVDVETELGQGTVFTVRLPAKSVMRIRK